MGPFSFVGTELSSHCMRVHHVQAVLDKHEADGTTETKEYQDAVGVFYSRHLCRLTPPPQEVVKVFEALQGDPSVYTTMCVACRERSLMMRMR